jgi:photosynthetic reaction center cytochrome c subunit
MIRTGKSTRALLIVATLPLLITGCEIGPKVSKQMGYRGTAMDLVRNPRLIEKANLQAGVIPPNAYETPAPGGQRARELYPELKELGDISVDEFNHLMANMTQWVVPAQGLPASEQSCNYCHNPANMASYEKYTKTVALRMIQMTRTINADYQSHVQQTGVTCWTCHRGQAVPAYKWAAAATNQPRGMLQGSTGQNRPAVSTAFASLPYDTFSAYLKDEGVNNIRVASTNARPTADHRVSIKTAEATYGLMMQMSAGLGVNCTYCHNTNNFGSWTNSTPQRVTSWHGLRMVAATNAEYITPLAAVFPAVNPVTAATPWRKGPLGDPYKTNCQTCHQGQPKPMNGVSMRDQAPVLWPAPRPAILAPMPQEAPVAATVPAATALVAGR